MSSDINKQKRRLRNRLLDQRTTITASDFFGASADIIEKLKAQDQFKEAKLIHSYVSMNDRREVETQELIIEMLGKGKRVVVPKTNFETSTLSHIEINSFDDLEENKWGVLEPEYGQEISIENLELVIVPMVGGDEECNRIGYGEGFYDRFLENIACPKIGLIFEQNIVSDIPVEEFDIPLDAIITEQRIIHRD